MEPAENRATALVERTRRRAQRHTLLRAFLRAVAAGLFLAAAATALARLAGISPGSWLLAVLLPVQVLAAIGAFRSRVTRRGAALLLDRETDAAERFTAVILAEDPEVRELAARQALAVPAVRDSGAPVRYPPSREGLAVALGLFLLVTALVLTGGEADSGEARAQVGLPSSSGVGSGSAAGGAGEPEDGTPAGDDAEVLSRVEGHVRSGEDIPEELWSDLEDRGVGEQVRAAVLEALARGDRDGAMNSLEAAVGGGPGRSGTDVDPAGGGSAERTVEHRWDGYEAALAAPRWDPRYDDIVRRYFEEAGR